jgi:enhancing lycopene biosynthesis protein 2
MALRVGVILSGCGFRDGAEVQESVLTLLALDRAGAKVRCFAPNAAQAKVTDHLSGHAAKEPRNVLAESARITRGAVEDVAKAKADDLDALVLPGGYGVTLNLSDFASKGKDATVNPDVARLLRRMHEQRKPIGAICIAPALVAKVLGGSHPTLTIGNDRGTADALEACGAKHRDCAVDAIVEDDKNRIVSTPAYMLGPDIRHVAEGIERCVKSVLRMAQTAAVA